MNKNELFVFVAGAAIGSLATWLLVKEYYKRLANEEIESMDEYYAQCDEYTDPEPEDEEPHDETVNGYHVKPDIMEYAKRTREHNYAAYSSNPQPESKPVNDDKVSGQYVERPYVISPEEFGEIGYSQMSLTYYADEILTDEDGDIIEDVDDMIGKDALETFGDYEEDSVFVRDDRREVDYEILADPRNYSDIFKINPHLAEDE